MARAARQYRGRIKGKTMNTLEKFETRQVQKIRAERKFPEFSPGDTLKVNVKVKEGSRERIQAYEGICIGRAGSGLNENFTVRKISYGYSPCSPPVSTALNSFAKVLSAVRSSITCATAPASRPVLPSVRQVTVSMRKAWLQKPP